MKTKYIKDFNNYKKLYKLTKSKNKVIEYLTDDDDEWFITVVYYNSNTGVVSDSYMKLRKEIDDDIESRKSEGYIT